MFKKILIANRGEIALRIMRTARRLGVRTVATVSAADRNQPFARLADEVVEIGEAPASQSYLRGDRVIAAARATGAQAIHPGYGFLAENAEFAQAVGDAGLTFIGPSPEAMARMGDKAQAKAIAAGAGVPVLAGSEAGASLKALAIEAKRIGYPVLIKALAGGGGRGMRVVARERDLAMALQSAQREAEAAFGNGRVLLERLIERPRHIEVQVFGDGHGNVVHLFERDCSLQRRHQKIIEEAPAPGMPDELRQRMCEAAVACAAAVGYRSAGTVEFLVEGGALTPATPFYFIEMNTRLQVEHPVTEAITGLDLVEWQLVVAAGERLPLQQREIAMNGHAIEGRLNAEDPARGFLPSSGPVVAFEPPRDVRVDSAIERGSLILPFYDSLVAKLIAHARDRPSAIDRLRAALDALVIAGPKTNAAFLSLLLDTAAFRGGEVDTGLVGRALEAMAPAALDARAVSAGVARLLLGEANTPGTPPSPWDARDAFQLGPQRRERRRVLVDGTPLEATIEWWRGGPEIGVAGAAAAVPTSPLRRLTVLGDGELVYVLYDGGQIELRWPSFEPGGGEVPEEGAVRAPIMGRLAKLLVREGASISKGDPIAIVEAMKMEHVLIARRAGKVATLAAQEGDQVSEGALIATLVDA